MTRFIIIAIASIAVILVTERPSASEGCEFSFFRAPDDGLGQKEPLPEPPALQDGQLVAGTTFPDPSINPYRNFYRLDTVVNGISRFCTAQVVGAPNILLTAAHCVQDNSTGKWVDHFQLRDLRNNDALPITTPKCVMTMKTWTKIPAGFPGRFYWPSDYALVVMPDKLNDDFLLLGQKDPGTVPVHAFGLPTGIGAHRRLVDIIGDLEDDPGQVGQGLVRHHQPNAALGVSGGSWVVENQSSDKAKSYTAVGLSTTVDQMDQTTFGLVGPRFDQCATEMMKAVQNECGR